MILVIPLQEIGSKPVRALAGKTMLVRAVRAVIASGREPVRQVLELIEIAVTYPRLSQVTPVHPLQAYGLVDVFQVVKEAQVEEVLDKDEAIAKRVDVSGLGGGKGEGGGDGELAANALQMKLERTRNRRSAKQSFSIER